MTGGWAELCLSGSGTRGTGGTDAREVPPGHEEHLLPWAVTGPFHRTCVYVGASQRHPCVCGESCVPRTGKKHILKVAEDAVPWPGCWVGVECPDKPSPMHSVHGDPIDFPLSPLVSRDESGAGGMDSSTLPAVAEELLREIKKAFQESSHGTCRIPAGSGRERGLSHPRE